MNMLFVFLVSSVAAWTEDFTQCNVGRAFGLGDSQCPSEGPKSVYMVASTQRTNNTAGFALQQK